MRTSKIGHFLPVVLLALSLAVVSCVEQKTTEAEYKYISAYPVTRGCSGSIAGFLNENKNTESFAYEIYRIDNPHKSIPYVESMLLLKSETMPSYQLLSIFYEAQEECFPDTFLQIDLDQPAYRALLTDLRRVRSEAGNSPVIPSLDGDTLIFSYKKGNEDNASKTE